MSILVNLVAGLIFGIGLIIAGMADPAKVLNFLDLAAIPSGGWDPSLAFVLAGAIAVTATGYLVVFRRPAPVFDKTFHLPPTTGIDGKLVAGAAIFGIGWGLIGFCPGPAFTALGTGRTDVATFVGAMLGGMLAARLLMTTAGRTASLAR